LRHVGAALCAEVKKLQIILKVAEGDERMKAALSIVTNYLSPDASCSVAGISEETRSTCVEVVTSKSTPDYEKIRDKLNAKNKSRKHFEASWLIKSCLKTCRRFLLLNNGFCRIL